MSEAFGTDQDEQAGAWKWTGAASPVVWCPSPNSRQQPDRNASVDNSAGSSAGGSGASSVSARRTQEEGSLPGGQEGGGAGSVGGEGEGEKEGVQADVEEQRDEKQRADQPEDGQEHPETGEGGAGSGVGTVRLAWIPGDPCSCVDAPGMVGEACRSWLITRAAALSSRDDGEKTAAGAEVGVVVWKRTLRLSWCLSICLIEGELDLVSKISRVPSASRTWKLPRALVVL